MTCGHFNGHDMTDVDMHMATTTAMTMTMYMPMAMTMLFNVCILCLVSSMLKGCM